MPELPEVETVRRDLTRYIVGKTITGLVLSKTKVVRNTRTDLEKILVRHHISAIGRIGKLLILSVNGTDRKLLIHLKMTGQLIYRAGRKIVAGGHSMAEQSFADLPNKHTRAEIHFAAAVRRGPAVAVAGGGKLFFNDMRLFAYLELVSPEQLKLIKSTYGIEPGTKAFTKEAFRLIFKNRKTSVKAILLNQKLIAGVGNIYADEACWRAKIRPSRRANRLAAIEIDRLHDAVEFVIKKGIEKRGTTFSHFVDGDGNAGGFLQFLRVYGRNGKPCQRCGTLIQKIVCAGRGTHYCPSCQR